MRTGVPIHRAAGPCKCVTAVIWPSPQLHFSRWHEAHVHCGCRGPREAKATGAACGLGMSLPRAPHPGSPGMWVQASYTSLCLVGVTSKASPLSRPSGHPSRALDVPAKRPLENDRSAPEQALPAAGARVAPCAGAGTPLQASLPVALGALQTPNSAPLVGLTEGSWGGQPCLCSLSGASLGREG